MDTLESLTSLEEFLLWELMRELNRGNVLNENPELKAAYTKYMKAVEDTQRYCYKRVAAMNRD